MVYIRIKKIQKQEYAYVVESVATDQGPRQKVKQYLGKVQRQALPDEIQKKVRAESKCEFLTSLVESHLSALGFVKRGKWLERENVIFSAADCSFKMKKTGKNMVLALEQGYLCEFTLQRLLSFTKSKNLNEDAHALARYFVEAGLQISEQEFVQFYSLL